MTDEKSIESIKVACGHHPLAYGGAYDWASAAHYLITKLDEYKSAGDRLKDEIKKLTKFDFNTQTSEHMTQYMRLMIAVDEWEELTK